ncbi:auxin-induced in root cultures protein 12 [Brachypodium distachyon]|uniref:auxin-induced in root cultures protein 12 n=1 Tax=Brachypodium distachyon TaxID=15368 RepID=UPI000D0D5C01|nr:auxin-induced in root cultures protein 12 [Brachypodium distachyon]|eukprot:XP_024310989.1 auxin-induced in root cultures protein 12 [Brachypodium distachyon]
MASATTTHHRGSHAILRLAAFLLLASASATVLAAGSSSACESEKFPAGRSYATCADLGALGATLHWTYDASTSSLSVAFSAKPPPGSAAGAGWVAWGVNTAGDGMKGAQSLVAFKSSGSSAYAVNTYNLTGYRPLGAASTPIDFKATGLAADASGADGKVRMYGVLQLPKGTEAVNHIWQVGAAVNNGAPAKHAFAKENLEAKGRLRRLGERPSRLRVVTVT